MKQERKKEKKFCFREKQHSSSIIQIQKKNAIRFKKYVNTRISRLLIRLRYEAASFYKKKGRKKEGKKDDREKTFQVFLLLYRKENQLAQ